MAAADIDVIKKRAEQRGMTVQEYVRAAVMREDRTARFMKAIRAADARYGEAMRELDARLDAEHRALLGRPERGQGTGGGAA